MIRTIILLNFEPCNKRDLRINFNQYLLIIIIKSIVLTYKFNKLWSLVIFDLIKICSCIISIFVVESLISMDRVKDLLRFDLYLTLWIIVI